MSESGYKSLYSVFIFLLAFTIINFYANKVKEEKRFKIEHQKMKEMKIVEQLKAQNRHDEMFGGIFKCRDFQSCHFMEIFVINEIK